MKPGNRSQGHAKSAAELMAEPQQDPDTDLGAHVDERGWLDRRYNGGVIDDLRTKTGLTIEIVKRTDDVRGFVVLPRRWVVERTNGWLCKSRLLNKEYERTIESSRADVLHAMTALMLRRLTTPAEERKELR
jgi:transposase